jgi:hypothetical protein
MKVTTSFAHGIRRASGEGRMLLLLWLVNLLFASILFFQFSSYFNELLATRAAGAGFLKAIDFNIILEIIAGDGAVIGRFIALAMLLFLAYGLFSVFLGGGILHTLWARYTDAEFEAAYGDGSGANKRGRMAPLFFQGAGKFFGRFFRLFVLALVLWVIVIVVMTLLGSILRPLTSDTPHEGMVFWMTVFKVAVGLFLAFLVRMFVDYARIRMVVEDSTSALKSLVRASGFVFRNFGKTLALYWLYVLTGAVIFVIFWLIDQSISNAPFLAVLVTFFIGQVFILSRGWVKVGLQAAQMEYFRKTSTAARKPPASEPAACEIPPAADLQNQVVET